MKNEIITPVYKKDTESSKDNYRSVSIIWKISKIYEQLISKQISDYFEIILSKFQVPEKGLVLNTVFYQCYKNGKRLLIIKKPLVHFLLIWPYDFSLQALRLMQSYLSNRKQRTKINFKFSSWQQFRWRHFQTTKCFKNSFSMVSWQPNES